MTVKKTRAPSYAKLAASLAQIIKDQEATVEALNKFSDYVNEKLQEIRYAAMDSEAKLLNQIGAVSAAKDSTPEMSNLDKAVMEDALIGLWMSEQAVEGKTTVDLTIVEHIRTGLRLAIAAR